MKLFDSNNWQLFGIDLGQLPDYWLTGIKESIPPTAIRALFTPLPRLMVKLGPEEVEFVLREADTDKKLGVAPINSFKNGQDLRANISSHGALGQDDKTIVELVLPDEVVVQKEIDLPLLAEADLRQSIGYQIPRLTPFSLDQVYFDGAILERNVEAQSLKVKILCAPKSVVDDAIATTLKTTGLRVAAVSTSDLSGRLNLLPIRSKQAVPNRNVIMIFILLLSLLLLAVAPLLKKRSVVIAQKKELLEMRDGVADILESRRYLTQHLGTLEYVIEQKQSYPEATIVLGELSKIIPASSYIKNFTLDGSNILMQGEGTDIVSLIETLESSKLIDSAEFSSAINHNPRTGLDQFVMKLKLASENI